MILKKKNPLNNEDDCPQLRTVDSLKELQDLKSAIDRAAIVSISDPKGMIIYVNDTALKVYGYTRAELIGKNHRILNSGIHSKDFFRNLWNTILTGNVWREEVCAKAKDGSLHWLDTTIVPFLNNDRVPYQFMAIRKEITEKKRLEEALAYERTRRSHIERLSAVGEMAANIAHEVKSPLTAILLQIQILRRYEAAGTFTTEIALATAEKIERLTLYLNKMVTGLLSFSRDSNSDEVEVVNVNHLVDGTIDFCAASLEKRNISIFREFSSEDLYVECRPIQISQALLNLLNNASDAVEHLSERWIRIGTEKGQGVVQITIADSGTSITPKIRARMMEPFFTTKKIGKGTGLGLSISRQIVESHGGQLFLASSENTCFHVVLPEACRKSLR